MGKKDFIQISEFEQITLQETAMARTILLSITLMLFLAFTAVADDLVRIDKSIAVPDSSGEFIWYDIRALDVEGQGWSDTKAPYDRLPGKAEGVVRDQVWDLSRQSAGICVRFVTDAGSINARWTLTSEQLDLPHMPSTGVSGLDLYVSTGNGIWRWINNGRPSTFPTNTAKFFSDVPAEEREFLLYLPLYNGVSSVEIGIPKESSLFKAPSYAPESTKPIVFYGTSITHGACASRPGMCHPAIVGRWMHCPFINLGFSGNGRMEPEVAHLLAELDPAVYILDCLPNMSAQIVAERVEPFVRILRDAHPETPILLVEDRTYPNSFLIQSSRERNVTSRAELSKAYGRLLEDGVPNLYYLSGDVLLGDDGEGTVDNSHPTDLGFMRQAEAFHSTLGFIFSDIERQKKR